MVVRVKTQGLEAEMEGGDDFVPEPFEYKGLCPKRVYPVEDVGNPTFKKRNLKDIEKMKELGFAYIGKSELCIWHRPSLN